MSYYPPGTTPPTPLTRTQQLMLTSWRWSALALDRIVGPSAALELSALHAVLASLRDVVDARCLFSRRSDASAEYALIVSLVGEGEPRSLANDILDTAFLLRWNELVADCRPMRELRRRSPSRDEPDVSSRAG